MCRQSLEWTNANSGVKWKTVRCGNIYLYTFPWGSAYLKIACLCQSIEINNNIYVYRQSQVRMPNGSGVRWAECLLIIGTDCRVRVYLAWFSIAQSVCQQAFSLLEIEFQRPSGFESCIQQRKTTCLLSIRKSLACARASKLTTTNMYVCMYVRTYAHR